MLKRKILISCFIIFILLCILNIYQVKADDRMSLAEFCSLSYDEAITYDVETELSLTHNGETNHGSYYSGPSNDACFHNSELDTGEGFLKIVNKVEILADGTIDGNEDYKFAGRQMAYYAYINTCVGTTDNYYHDGWSLTMLYMESVYNVIKVETYASKSSYQYPNADYTLAKQYAETGNEDYVAVCFIIEGHDGDQDRIVVFGKQAETSYTVDKYINKVEDLSPKLDSEDMDFGTLRSEETDSAKIDDPVKISSGKVKVYYTINIKNKSKETLKGTLADVYNETFFSNLKVISGGKIGDEISIEPGEEKTYEISLKGNSRVVVGVYENAAIFTAEDGSSKSSSDWISIGEVKTPEINKYITKITGVGSFSRSNMSEDDKTNNPVNAGDNSSVKKITYMVKIHNPNTYEISGVFKDEADSGVIINSMSCSNDSTITIPAKGTKSITITASVAEGTPSGIYGNTAQFTYDTMEVESSDYFEIEEEETYENIAIKKYVSNVTDSPGSYKSGRESMSTAEKNTSPAEVINGSIVTYTIELKNEIHYNNSSGSCHGSRCSHLDIHKLDYLKCIDTYDKSKLEYVSISGSNGVTYNTSTGEIKWTDVEEDETVKADITFKVIASNMQITNIENKVNNIQYQYTKYSCTVYHGYYRSYSCSNHGRHTYCTHTSCGFNHHTSKITGSMAGADADYLRVLDPEVKGNVWVETTIDGYKKDSESLTGMTAEQKKVVVKLVCDGNEVASRVIDSSGNYDFGRVRKGSDRSVTSGNVNEYDDIGTGNYFYYTSDTLITYTLEFYYDGEKFESTTYLGDTNLNSDHSMKTEFEIDSNAKEDESERETFNNSLETIGYNKAYAGTSGDSSSKTLAYNTSYRNTNDELATSELKWDGNLSNPATKSITMKATSFQIFFEDGEVDYLQHMNLGLVPRNRADMSIQKDVYTAEVTVNGYQTKYIYDGLTSSNINSNNTIKTAYKLKIYNEDYSFRTSDYDSEIQTILNVNNAYDSYERSNDLEILLTYKITITNNSEVSDPTLDSEPPIIKIREIVDYSSNEMTIASNNDIYEVRAESITGDYLGVSNSTEFKSISSKGSGFNRNIITGLDDYSLEAGESLDVFITYKVNKINGAIIKNEYESSTAVGTFNGKYNVAEIASYSVYKEDEKPAGLIDRNSNPANLDNPANTKIYEDDTFQTTIDVLLRTDNDSTPTPDPNPGSSSIQNSNIYRMISGNVWEEIGEDVGDGIKDSNDVGAPNVIVKLYEVVEDTGNNIEYLVDTGVWQRTKSDGNYVFGGEKTDSANGSTDDSERIHAGRYIVRFIYGDEPENLKEYTVGSSLTEKTTGLNGMTIRYSGQDYKSAIYKEVGTTNENEILEATEFDKTSNGKIYSFAKDNEQRRIEVNAYSSTMTYSMDEILKATTAEEKEILSANTSMYADTKKFNIQIEDYDKYNQSNDSKYHENVILIGVEEGKGNHTIAGGKTYLYGIKNVNFGLIERPSTKLELMNDITEVIAKTEDGTVILDAKFNIIYTYDESGTSSDTVADVRKINHYTVVNEKESVGLDQVQVLNRNGANQGFRYANIDTDILQGLNVTLKFRIAIANLSESDYISEVGQKLVENSIVELKESYREANSGSSLSDLTKTPLDSSGYDYYTYYNDNKITNELAYMVGNKIIVKESEYDYSSKYDSSINTLLSQSQALKTEKTSKEYNYKGGSSVGTPAVSTSYTYKNLTQRVPGYYYGYYVGNYYYRGTKTAASYNTGEDVVVETRVDKIIDYVDNDLVFKPEENKLSQGSSNTNAFTTYSIPEITEKGLLKGILGSSSLSASIRTNAISDSEQDYVRYDWNNNISSDYNNLAFSVEDSANGNNTLYKYLTNKKAMISVPINESNIYNTGLKQDLNGDNKYTNINLNILANPFDGNESTYLTQVANNLYYIDLQASRTLSSEDSAGIQLENLSEIIKVSNNVGRKVDVTSSSSASGYLGNTTEAINTLYGSSTAVALSRELDTDFSEYVTFSPPTGLSKGEIAKLNVENNIVKIVEIVIAVLVIIFVLIFVIIKFKNRKKFYR